MPMKTTMLVLLLGLVLTAPSFAKKRPQSQPAVHVYNLTGTISYELLGYNAEGHIQTRGGVVSAYCRLGTAVIVCSDTPGTAWVVFQGGQREPMVNPAFFPDTMLNTIGEPLQDKVAQNAGLLVKGQSVEFQYRLTSAQELNDEGYKQRLFNNIVGPHPLNFNQAFFCTPSMGGEACYPYAPAD
jgi:hypothetical protein